MKVIMITEEELNKEFQNLLDRLKLEDLENQKAKGSLHDIFRKYNYELHQFKDALVKSKL